MKLKDYIKKEKKRSPKTWARIGRRWDIKMIGPVDKFLHEVVLKNINPRLVKLARKDEFIFDGPTIEGELFKLLAKVRRITQKEK